jgi:hypothetical protein
MQVRGDDRTGHTTWLTWPPSESLAVTVTGSFTSGFSFVIDMLEESNTRSMMHEVVLTGKGDESAVNSKENRFGKLIKMGFALK